MAIDFLLKVFDRNRDARAIVWRDTAYEFAWLLSRIEQCERVLSAHDVTQGTVVALEADFSPTSVAMFLALIQRGCVVVPLSSSAGEKKEGFIETAVSQVRVMVDNQDAVVVSQLPRMGEHP